MIEDILTLFLDTPTNGSIVIILIIYKLFENSRRIIDYMMKKINNICKTKEWLTEDKIKYIIKYSLLIDYLCPEVPGENHLVTDFRNNLQDSITKNPRNEYRNKRVNMHVSHYFNLIKSEPSAQKKKGSCKYYSKEVFEDCLADYLQELQRNQFSN